MHLLVGKNGDSIATIAQGQTLHKRFRFDFLSARNSVGLHLLARPFAQVSLRVGTVATLLARERLGERRKARANREIGVPSRGASSAQNHGGNPHRTRRRGGTWGRHEMKHAELGLGVPRGGAPPQSGTDRKIRVRTPYRLLAVFVKSPSLPHGTPHNGRHAHSYRKSGYGAVRNKGTNRHNAGRIACCTFGTGRSACPTFYSPMILTRTRLRRPPSNSP